MTDWTVLDIDGVTTVAHHAATKVAHQYSHTTTYDDLYQEAMILLATHPDTVRRYTGDAHLGLGLLHRWLWCDLTDLVKTDGKIRSHQVSYETVRASAVAA